MRIQIVEGNNKKICGICNAKDNWIQEVKVDGVLGYYCLKCDTLTLSNPFVSEQLAKNFKIKCDLVRTAYLSKKY